MLRIVEACFFSFPCCLHDIRFASSYHTANGHGPGNLCGQVGVLRQQKCTMKTNTMYTNCTSVSHFDAGFFAVVVVCLFVFQSTSYFLGVSFVEMNRLAISPLCTHNHGFMAF